MWKFLGLNELDDTSKRWFAVAMAAKVLVLASAALLSHYGVML
jgi:hypothetical protein